ncbi:hypothetical protein KEJ33_02155 [Candidatus Bathyarchaeota archaeon]|nr:hypothetical protein [Candidatus Bathyarchaeota archaeon]
MTSNNDTFSVMSKTLSKLGRKILSLALIFNSLLSLTFVISNLASSYPVTAGEKQYWSYLIGNSVFLFVFITSILNILTAKLLGKVELGRIWFHHYVYGFLASSVSFTLMAIFAPTYILVFLIPSLGFQAAGLQMFLIYSGLFFVYGGLTLVIDDVRDVSVRLGRVLDKLKIQAYKSSRALQKIHLISSLATVCISLSLYTSLMEKIMQSELWTVQNVIISFFATSLLITALWGLRAIKAKYWFTKLYQDLARIEPMLRNT